LAETAFLRSLASDRRCAIEVGVFEGATSAVLAEAMPPEGTLYLVDPYDLGVRLEGLLGFSFTWFVAQRSVRPWRQRVHFVRTTSFEAALSHPLDRPADLIFVDADHSYEAVRQDFLAWAPKLVTDGVMAFHDSRCCPARPDLNPSTGPVRLMSEIRLGLFGSWEVTAEADSLTAVAPFNGRRPGENRG